MLVICQKRFLSGTKHFIQGFLLAIDIHISILMFMPGRLGSIESGVLDSTKNSSVSDVMTVYPSTWYRTVMMIVGMSPRLKVKA